MTVHWNSAAEEADAVIFGAGPAGLTAAVEFSRLGKRPIVLEKDTVVGGIARTESYRGYHFDMGGHRFFTKVAWVNDWWHEVLGKEFMTRPRLSRIYYRGKFFSYPPSFFNAMKGLGPFESARIVTSYVKAQLLPVAPVLTFEHWVSNSFGRRLFQIFFKAYTEKVWGVRCDELRAEWAAQRIKNMSLRTVIRNMLVKTGRKVASLIEEFQYPRLGPGMMWRKAAERVEAEGGTVLMQAEVVAVHRQDMRITGADVRVGGETRHVRGTHFVSSMPVTELIAKLTPAVPAEIAEAAARLRYRDFLTVCVIVEAPDLFPDNWIYVHEPQVQVARIQNFKNWSPHMVPDAGKSSLGLEYFCNEGDGTWTMSDGDLIALAAKELVSIGLIAKESMVSDGCVFRVPKAYPIYDADYAEALDLVRRYCDGLVNLRTVGRNGLHRYNNQDHSMLTAYLAVRSLVLGETHDLWAVNTEQEYHETSEAPVDEAKDAVMPKPLPASA